MVGILYEENQLFEREDFSLILIFKFYVGPERDRIRACVDQKRA